MALSHRSAVRKHSIVRGTLPFSVCRVSCNLTNCQSTFNVWLWERRGVKLKDLHGLPVDELHCFGWAYLPKGCSTEMSAWHLQHSNVSQVQRGLTAETRITVPLSVTNLSYRFARRCLRRVIGLCSVSRALNENRSKSTVNTVPKYWFKTRSL